MSESNNPSIFERHNTLSSTPISDDLPPKIIETRQLVKAYGSDQVLKGVDLVARQGQVVSMIGSSGSGKSTLLRCLNLLEYSQQGDILFANEMVRWTKNTRQRKPESKKQVIKIRTRLGMVFQQFNLWMHMTVIQNVMEAPVTVMGCDPEITRIKAMEYLAKVGMDHKAEAYPSELSGGQQQRVAIARALCTDPEALLLDEPTSSLDPELQQEVVKVIQALAQEGRTMLLVTHDMSLARDVSDEILFLHKGVVEEQGAPKNLLENPQSKKLQQFLSAADA